jgi:transcriptional regulator with GAF, ATPase, and Fis domain/serine/threonine protein kinase
VALFGRYEYLGELGRGSSGRVLAVLDRSEGGAARAFKVVAEEHEGRLLWEFARLSRIEHRRVARVRELLRVEARVPAPFSLAARSLLLVEDRAPGQPLSRLLEQSEVSHEGKLGVALSVALGIAEGLAALHDAGLVHGDLKPDNVMWDAEQGATLVDLGFARAPSTQAEPRGTPRFMAPELFAGLCTPAADVYALGALLFDWLAGEPLESPSTRSAGGERGLLATTRDVAALGGLYPSDLQRTLSSFLHRDPERRPANGRAALGAVLGLHQALGFSVDPESVRFAGAAGLASPAERSRRARALPFVGHEVELDALVDALDRSLNSAESDAPIRLLGVRGAGRTRLAREALRRLQERRAMAGKPVPTVVSSTTALADLRDVDAVLWLDRPQSRELIRVTRAQTAFRAAGRALCVVVEAREPSAQQDVSLTGAMERRGVAAPEVWLGALEPAAFAELLGRLLAPLRPSPQVHESAHEGSGGYAGRLCELVAQALASGRELTDPESFRAGPETLDPSGWSPAARELALWLAWGDGLPHDPALIEQLLGDPLRAEQAFDELASRGALREAAAGVGLTLALARRLRTETRAHARERFARFFVERSASQAPFLQALVGEHRAAVRDFGQRARGLVRRGQVDEARQLLREALDYAEDEELKLELADLQRRGAEYQAGIRTLEGVHGPAAAWLRAELSRLAGHLAQAREALEAVEAPAGPWTERAWALRARLQYDAGDFAGAREALRHCAESRDPLARVRSLEVEILLAQASSSVDDEKLRELTSWAERLGQDRGLARSLSLRAHVENRRGRRGRAMDDLRQAVQLARRAGELHEAATYGLNLGLLELEQGMLGAALESLRESAYVLAFIDRPADLVRVLFNLGSAALLIGDDERADWVLSEAGRRAEPSSDGAARALIAVAQSELWLRRGAIEHAEHGLEVALRDLPAELSALRGLLLARAGLVQILRGDLERAAEYERLGEQSRSVRESDIELVVLQIRLALAQGEPARAARTAERVLSSASLEEVPFAERFRMLLAAADAARAGGLEQRALEWSALARGLLERAFAGLPGELRARMRKVPAYARVLVAPAAMPAGEPGRERWRTLVKSGRRLFAEQRPTRIAQRLTELALDLVHAERALVVVEADARDAAREPGAEARALRVLARAELGGEQAVDHGFSRSVVERVWLEGGAVVTVEAARDERFDHAQSVHRLSVRSVLAVPLEGFAERAVLYLDDRLRGAAFGEDDLALISDLAELTRQALKVGNAVVKEQRRALSAAQHEKKLARQLASLVTGKPSESGTPFVGTSSALRRLTERAGRVAQADVPLLISGPSGSGKELLARFLHAQSPRRAAPFVAENCAALPDTLLESALFGHVRGAFTGADRPRRGLFDLADGGSLLLDEVAEMSPALQGKLLRVLQEGEFRVLGSEKVRRVDVRVMAASHRDLTSLVRSGAFREDLFYRLAVVTLEVPSLAERREDIPLLVQHFVQKHAGGRQVRVSAEALRLFEARNYPGNVRQLENEVRRALALADADITTEHVEEPTVKASASSEPSLDLHAQTEALTRTLVEAAMQRSGGNVSQAAQLLGVSRFGLQKILKRLAATSSPQRK